MAVRRWPKIRRETEAKRTPNAATLELLRPVSWQQRLARIFLLYAAIVSLCSFLDSRALFKYLERYAADYRIGVYGNQAFFEQWAREHIVILALSDDSFDVENNPHLPVSGPPVPRSFQAKIVRDLTRAGAKVIAFDFLFGVPRPPDKEFAAAARQSGRVLWACRFQNDGSESGAGQQLLLPVPALLKASPHFGHINAPKDEEQMGVTRIPAVTMYRGQPIPALSVVAAQMYLGLENEPLQRTAQGWQIGKLTIPVDENNYFTIKYLGTKPGEIFEPLPYESVYNGYVDSENYKQQEKKGNSSVTLRDKIVLVGDTTTLGHDVVLTPLKEMAGVEVHAHAIATILRNSFTSPVSPAMNFAVLSALTLIVCLIAASCRSTGAVLASGLLVAAFCVFNIWMFVEHSRVLRMVAPCTAMMLATIAVVAERNLIVERGRQRASALLQRYVSPQIANYLLAHPEKCALGGSRVTATVLFSDIRGFTAMSEKLAPEAVLERLNEYLQEMTDVVFRYDGALDKYIGDAVMALFGVPLSRPDHAHQAVAAAIGMQDALVKLQERWRAEGLPSMDIGIGINSGDMIFGNMGANQHMDFSVLGDAVNLASRVESLNKDLRTRILVTASTYESVRHEVRARGPITAHVKGREEEVTVYEIFGWKEAETLNEEPILASLGQ